jgi:primosomal protein N' (replication factor Y) (superfamily II helicase)
MQFPPTSYFALLKAEASDYNQVLKFLHTAVNLSRNIANEVIVYDPIRPQMERIKGMERGQLLLQAPSRQALQQLLRVWMPALRSDKQSSKIRWALDMDPLEF